MASKALKYEGLDTYSFKIFEFIHNDFYEKILKIKNPKIDTSSAVGAKALI